MTHGPGPGIPDVRLERFRLGELPPDEMQTVREQAWRDAGLRTRLDALAQSDREIAAQYPARLVVSQIRRRLDAEVATAPGARRPAWTRLAPAGALVLLLAAVAVPTLLRDAAVPDIVRLKGSAASLVVYRRLSNGSERLGPGATARRGEQVRVGYRAAGKTHGAILSVDPKGNVTLHLPRDGRRAVALEPSGLVMLDTAYELDATPGWERFYFVTASAAFDIEPVIRAARDAAKGGTIQAPPALRLGGGLEQFVFTLAKDERE